MRVALVCGDLSPAHDGVAHYTSRLAEELAARGLDVLIATLPAPHPPIRTHGVRVVEATDRWDLRGVVRLARTLRALDVDVVHVQFAPSAFGWHGAVGVLPALLRGRPRLVTTLHEYDWWTWAPRLARPVLTRAVWPGLERRGWWDRETALLTTRADAVVTTNPSHRVAVRRRIPGVPVHHVPIGSNLRAVTADRETTRTAVRAALRMPAGAPLVAFFGFIHAVKGIPHLLAATARLREGRAGLRLLLIGGFESLALRGAEAAAYESEVRGMIATHGLDDAVTITGWLPEEEVSRLLTAADLAVLPFTAGATTKSGSLLACAEHALPLVCTAASPPDPTLADGETAVLVATRDAASLAAGIARVLGDPALGARLGKGARRIAAAHGWKTIAGAHLGLYRAPVPTGAPGP